MEDQGRRLMLAVLIAFGIMMVWSVLFPPDKPPKKEAKDDEIAQVADRDSADGTEGTSPDATPGAASGAGEDGAKPTEVVVPRGEEQFFDFEFDNLRVRFSSYGASLKSWQLLAPRLRDRKRNQPEDLVPVKKRRYENLRVWFEDSTYDVPKGAEWKGEKLSNTEMRFTWESKDIRVVKDIILHPEQYLAVMKVSLELVGAESATQSLAVSMYSTQDPKVEGGGMFDRVERKWTSACFYGDEVHTRSSRSLMKKGEKKRSGQIYWGGFDHAYFLTALAFKGAGDRRIDCNAYPLDDIVGGMRLDMVQSSVELKKGEPGLRSTMVLHLGPKYRDSLRAADELAGTATKFDESVDLGFLGILAGPLLGLLNFFQSFVGNWGIAILLLTFVVKGVTLPWTHKSMKSMKSMAKLKPQLEKIKEKHKDDRAKQNVETMNLFKSHKVNPMSGCLPMLLQMPIWFALYRALTVSAQLYQAPFIPGWIEDLTLPDPFYIMPILLTGMMFLQTRLTPSTGTGAQQKVLMYGMPIMFGGFSFFFPAGLTLYIFANTCFTAAHHLYMHKTDPATATKPAVVASENVIDVEATEEAKGDESKSGGSSSKPASSSKKKKSGKGKKKRKR